MPMRPFVERLDRDLVALADLAEDLRLRHDAVLEDQLAGAAGADAELVFLLADGESRRAAIDDERGDAAVAGIGIDVREHDEHVRFVAVGDPQLAAVDREAVAVSVARVASANASLPEPASDRQ
jgi:hypothetical protein